MFYKNTSYEEEILGYINDAKQEIGIISMQPSKVIRKSIPEIEISLVIKSTGKLELYFDDILKEFALSNSSIIFHKYFNNNFTKAGKNAKPDSINGILKVFDANPVKKDCNFKEYTSLESLYNLRNAFAHGDCNITDTFEQIVNYINFSIGFMKKAIESLDDLCK